MPATDDTISHADLIDLDIRRDAALLLQGIDDITSRSERFDGAVLIALACAFMGACEEGDVDAMDTFAQIADLFEGGEIDLEDDPAGGRWVHHTAGNA